MSEHTSHQRRRGGAGPKAVAAEIERLTRPAIGRRGFAEAGVITEWPAIVGPALAAQTCPLKITRAGGESPSGTLHLRVASGAMAMQLQHLEPLVIERVNGYFGYRAIDRLAITQGPLPRRKPAKPKPQPADPAAVAPAVATVSDPALKEALAELGRWVLGRRP